MAEEVIHVVEEAIKTGTRVVWIQEGIISNKAATKALEAGLLVIIDKYIIEGHLHVIYKKGKQGGEN